ncbi:regulator [Streptomyces sp. NPDC046860]|uniref:regulator n=1 Tax=Streptomyces sp. NPDC046860 TaxID=3154495 RepID=UPI0033E3808C
MTTSVVPADLRSAVMLLASPSLIRLVTEIDDHGSIPPRRLAGTLPDLTSHHLRRATEAARAHDLVRDTPGAGLELTPAGAELADLYDTLGRWARRHAYPLQVCDFTTRVHHTLGLLTRPRVAEDTDAQPSVRGVPSAEAEQDLVRPRALLIQWLTGNPQIGALPECESAA